MKKTRKLDWLTSGIAPSGAAELLIALQTPSTRGHLSIPAVVWSPPGEGKTSFVESLAEDGFPVHVEIASIHDPTDYSGLPVATGDRVRFIPPEWALQFDETQQGILFLDELSTAPPTVQAALLRVILERRVGGQALPKGVRIVAAANPPDVAAGGWELSPPLCNRFVHIQWDLSGKPYADSLLEGFAQAKLPTIDPVAHAERLPFWKEQVAAFLRLQPALSRTKPADTEYAFASPRTWEFAVRLLTSCDLLGLAPKAGSSGSPVAQQLLSGSVGKGAGSSFLGFLKKLNFPDPERILDGTVDLRLKALNDDDLFVLFSYLSKSLQEKVDGNSDKFLNASMRFLSLVDEVRGNGRLDTIFAQVRRVAKSQVLQKTVLAAHQQNRTSALQKLLKSVFEDTTLATYVKLMEGSHESR